MAHSQEKKSERELIPKITKDLELVKNRYEKCDQEQKENVDIIGKQLGNSPEK